MTRIPAALSLGLLLFLSNLGWSAAAQTRTTVTVRLVDTLSSGSNQPGDMFTGTLATPLVINDHILAEKDARIIGQVREVVSSGRLKRPALITLSLNAVQTPAGRFSPYTALGLNTHFQGGASVDVWKSISVGGSLQGYGRIGQQRYCIAWA